MKKVVDLTVDHLFIKQLNKYFFIIDNKLG